MSSYSKRLGERCALGDRESPITRLSPSSFFPQVKGLEQEEKQSRCRGVHKWRRGSQGEGSIASLVITRPVLSMSD